MTDANTPDRVLVPFSAPEAKCRCGLHILPANIHEIEWHWGHHRRDGCLVDDPEKICWCGLTHKDHQTTKGHLQGEVHAVALRELQQKCDAAFAEISNLKTKLGTKESELDAAHSMLADAESLRVHRAESALAEERASHEHNLTNLWLATQGQNYGVSGPLAAQVANGISMLRDKIRALGTTTGKADADHWEKRWRAEFDLRGAQHQRMAELWERIHKLEAEKEALEEPRHLIFSVRDLLASRGIAVPSDESPAKTLEAILNETGRMKVELQERAEALSRAGKRLEAWEPLVKAVASAQTNPNMKAVWEACVEASRNVPPEHRVNLCEHAEPSPLWRRRPEARPVSMAGGVGCRPDCPYMKQPRDCPLTCPARGCHPEHPQPSGTEIGWQCSSACRFFHISSNDKCPSHCPALEHHPKASSRLDETAEEFMNRKFPGNWVCGQWRCSDPAVDRMSGAWECGLLKTPPGYVNPVPNTLMFRTSLKRGSREAAIELFAAWHGWRSFITTLNCERCGGPRLLGPSPLCDDCRAKKEG